MVYRIKSAGCCDAYKPCPRGYTEPKVRRTALITRAAIVATIGVAIGSAAGSSHASSTATRCGKWAVPARIAGNPVCLKDNRHCVERRSQQYRRYGFDCHGGFLVTRWEYLRKRPLTGVEIAPGQPCPVTTETGRVGANSGLGPGPAYPLGTHNAVVLRMPPPESWGTEWSGVKRVWLLDTLRAGRALIRGRQLDGPNEIRFVKGPQWTPAKVLNPVRDLQVEGPTPSFTRLRAPGCYAYQVDGRTFSYLVIFDARLATGG